MKCYCENCTHSKTCKFKEDYIKQAQDLENIKLKYNCFNIELICYFFDAKVKDYYTINSTIGRIDNSKTLFKNT